MTKKDAENIILSTLNGLLKTDAENLYLSHIINWNGYVEDTNIKHTELVIKHLYKEKVIENYKINGIKEVTRDKSYYTKEHIDQISQKKVLPDDNRINDLFFLDSCYAKENKVQIDNEIRQYIQIDEQKDVEKTRISEENFIKDLFTYSFYEKELGTPIDFYIPLDNDNSQIIDLVTFNHKTSEIFLVDVKPPNSDVTALRCCMEIQTYYQKLNKEKFLNDLFEAGVIPTKQLKIRKGIIIFEASNAFNDLTFREKRYLEKLIKYLNIEICFAGRTETEIKEELRNDIEMYGRNQLYLHQLLGYPFITSDTKSSYSEVFSKDLLDNNFYLDSLNIEEEIVFSIEITNREQKYLFNNTHLIPKLEDFVLLKVKTILLERLEMLKQLY